MRRKRGGKVTKPRICAFCNAAIADQRPSFLVATEKGQVIGPYHAGCAERLVLVHKGKKEMERTPGATNYGTILSVREETLPW